MDSTAWLDFWLLTIVWFVSSMQLPQTDLPLFHQVTTVNWLVADWQNMIIEVLQASSFYVQNAPISLAEVVQSCLRTVSSGQFKANLNCSSTNGSFNACVFVWNFELSTILLYELFMMKFMKPWEETKFFFIENLLKFTYSNVEIKKIRGLNPRTPLQQGKG